jgi:hypothetical protein
MLTERQDRFNVVGMESSESFWERWDRIRESSDPDPLEVLRLTAAFTSYFRAAQKEAISFADSDCGNGRVATSHCSRFCRQRRSGGGMRYVAIPMPGTRVQRTFRAERVVARRALNACHEPGVLG